MTDADVVHLCAQALVLAAKLVGPLLLATLVIGVVVSLLQAVFQVQDSTLAMVPKLVVGGLVLAGTGGWMLRQAVEYTTDLWSRIPELVH